MATDASIGALRGRELPLLERQAYLDYATLGPLPVSHARAAAETLERLAREGPRDGEATHLLEAARVDAAALLGADAASVALLRSTGEGVGLVAEGLTWRDGDEVVLYEREFVGCAAPFLRLRDRGVRIRLVPDAGDRLDAAAAAAQLSSRTRVLCVSLVSRVHGQRAPVEDLRRLCAERGIWLVLDAAQAMGVLALDAPALGADVVAAHGYKFLCAGFGLAPTWCSPRAVAELRPPLVGWKNTAVGPDGEAASDPPDLARRFEPTLPGLAALAGLRASLAVLGELGPRLVEERALGLADRAAEGLAARGYDVPHLSRPPGERSSLVVARRAGLDADRLVAALHAADVACSAVDGALRVSLHGFNTGADVERLLEALPAAERSAAG